MSYGSAAVWKPSAGTITPWSPECLGIVFASMGITAPIASSAWVGSGVGLFIPFELSNPVVVTGGFYYAQSGTATVDIGVYRSNGTRIVSKGPTTMAAGFQALDLTDTLVFPGRYYIGFSSSLLSASFMRANLPAPIPAALGVKQAASVSTLPATASWSDTTATFVPAVGLTLADVNP